LPYIQTTLLTMYKYATLCIWALFLQVHLSGQRITGQIIDPTGAPAGFASVRLLLLADSSLVSGVSADSTGAFQLTAPRAGQYCIKAALLGFEDLYSGKIDLQPGQPVTLPTIRLQTSRTLQTVTVNGRKPLIENLPDKVVINIDGSALAAGNSALELLQRSPGVVVTPQDNILLNGKGSTAVMIDGRRVQMDPQQLAAFLKSIPGESIQRIDLIAHPSAKYEAEGLGGIIDIRLKKHLNRGFNGNLSLGNTQGIHRRLRAGVDLNLRLDKLNLFANYNYVDAAQSIEQSIDRLVGTKSFGQTNPKVDTWTSHQFKTGADWAFDDRHTLGVFVLGNAYDNTTRATSATLIRQAGAARIDSSLQGSSINPERNTRLDYNLNYRFADTLGAEWTFDADRIAFRMRGSNTLDNRYFNDAYQPTGVDAIHSDLQTDVALWSLKTDWVKSRKNGLKTEAGARINWTATMNDIAGATSMDNGAFVPAPGRTNRADFRERLAAAYGNIGRQTGKWNWQAGLRIEHTDLTGASTDIAGTQTGIRDQHYTDLFPNAFAQYNLSANHQLGAYYGRRISRPAYQDLNPFIWQTDPYTSERGNPNLTPAYTQSLELKYTYRQAASLALGYAHTDHLVSTIARQTGDQVYTQPENLARQDNISLNLNVPTPIASWWEGYLWIGVWHNRFRSDLPEGLLDQRSFGGGSWIGQQFKLPYGIQLDVSCWAQFPSIDGMVRNHGIWSLDLGLKKRLLQDKLTLKIGLNDVFKSQKWTESVDFGSVHGIKTNHWESQALAVSLSWNFGKSGQSRERKSGAESENGRIKGGKHD
jgi:hypothetical protein